MAKRLIVQVPDPILAKKCREVDKFDERLWTLLDDMKDTLFDANGAGLAAPQVAVLKRVALVDTEDGFYELINPVIKSMKGEQTGLEGCLSVKGKYGTVTRANDVTVIAQDRYGKKHTYKVSGFTARAFQHEIDHLDGIVYTSKCSDLMDDEE
ncbi:MAG: peptide deformylase [Clostridia bacterium]|nr:peptide deformylase [Clostridia bacterium]MBR2485621.1 peptide deformylase [Clostridia bacterium]